MKPEKPKWPLFSLLFVDMREKERERGSNSSLQRGIPFKCPKALCPFFFLKCYLFWKGRHSIPAQKYFLLRFKELLPPLLPQEEHSVYILSQGDIKLSKPRSTPNTIASPCYSILHIVFYPTTERCTTLGSNPPCQSNDKGQVGKWGKGRFGHQKFLSSGLNSE